MQSDDFFYGQNAIMPSLAHYFQGNSDGDMWLFINSMKKKEITKLTHRVIILYSYFFYVTWENINCIYTSFILSSAGTDNLTAECGNLAFWC